MKSYRVYAPDVVRAALQRRMTEKELNLQAGAKGVLVGTYQNALHEIIPERTKIPIARRLIFGWLFGDGNAPLADLSSKVLTPGQWFALHRWKYGETSYERGAWKRELWEMYWRVMLCVKLSLDEMKATTFWPTLDYLIGITKPVKFFDYVDVEYLSMVDAAIQLGGIVTSIDEILEFIREEVPE